mmetsp:Transcript_71610/g.126445  ORF Transcript_71610/g.126445 Transcript_71610/m.126445 type:complete len:156 (-) Transcript_71610:1-468(-)
MHENHMSWFNNLKSPVKEGLLSAEGLLEHHLEDFFVAELLWDAAHFHRRPEERRRSSCMRRSVEDPLICQVGRVILNCWGAEDVRSDFNVAVRHVSPILAKANLSCTRAEALHAFNLPASDLKASNLQIVEFQSLSKSFDLRVPLIVQDPAEGGP